MEDAYPRPRIDESLSKHGDAKFFTTLNKEIYEALTLKRWLDKSGHPIPENPELPVEKAAEIKILSKKDTVPLDLLPRSNLAQQEYKQPLIIG